LVNPTNFAKKTSDDDEAEDTGTSLQMLRTNEN